MEHSLSTDSLDSDDGNSRTDQNQSLDKKYPSSIVEIDAEMKDMKDGEDFPCLCNFSSVFMRNNIVLFGGEDNNGNRNNVLNIYDLEELVWS